MDKALITLEGILKQLNPEFDYFAAAQPYVQELVARKKSPLGMLKTARKNVTAAAESVSAIPRQVRSAVGKLLRGDIQVKLQHEGLREVIRDLDRSSNRLAFSVITAAIIVASSIIIHSGAGHKLFGIPVFGLIGYIIAGLFGVWILIGILRSGQL
jgi:ubiquinone biosynthesis protein